ncbi:F-box-like domain containing protein [Asbolus verrucosus]|uniref:F-box-like domain containing protein n=1 Tax=Asbolus verrucosus TaxID=1661398 RepID=A0A482VSA7_ASBVE|nr:F-box-like domain containing protein [Asbolus verrucosus]
MLCCEKNPYNLRNKQSCKRRQSFGGETAVEKKRLRSFDHITSLPDEILLHIFSYLKREDLYYNVRSVCRRWNRIAMFSSSWKEVIAGNEIPTGVLSNWLHFSPVIKHFRISDRNDADVILEAISKSPSHVESITIINCWGSSRKLSIRSNVLCNLLTRCKKLGRINFENVKIRSCKFFKLLAKRRNGDAFLQLCYIGPVTPKQYNVLKESCSGWIFTELIEVV